MYLIYNLFYINIDKNNIDININNVCVYILKANAHHQIIERLYKIMSCMCVCTV